MLINLNLLLVKGALEEIELKAEFKQVEIFFVFKSNGKIKNKVFSVKFFTLSFLVL